MCSVVECDSWRRSAPRFNLPEDPERRLEWVQFLFEVNRQRLKESCWTDITICSEHFADVFLLNVFPTGTVKLRSNAVPSLCIKTEPEELEPCQEPVEATEVASQCDTLENCGSPSSYSDESGPPSVAAPESPVPSDASDAFMSDYGQMLQRVVNIDMIREKAGLLQMKKKYVVNENRLLQLFRPKCPICGCKIKVEKFTYGVLIILNQQCLQCKYRNQWKSQLNASVPAAEDQHLTGGVDVTSEIKEMASTDDDNNSTISGSSDMVTVIYEDSDPMDETEESGDEGNMGSDEDWTPMDDFILDNELHSDESDDESENYDDDPLVPKHSQLCTDCGKFFNKRKPHVCEHKVKPYSCNICGKRCVSEGALTSHSRVHDDNYEHHCKYCYVTFKTKVDKINHEQTHINQEKPYKCPDCSETFATNKERRIHLENHRGSLELKCHICGIEFYRTINLRRHLVVHTGVKPFICSVCQRGFNQASHLKSHMRLHTGERPFKCQHCDKCFNHNVSLKSHVQRYHMSHSRCEQKKGKKRKTVSDTVDAQENGNKKGTDSGLDGVKKEKVQKQRKDKPKRKRKSTGRPIGRPKRNAAGKLVLAEEMQGRGSNTKTAKVKVRTSKTTKCSDEESDGEPTESDASFDSAEEEEETSEKVTSSTSRVRGGAKQNSDSDPDFDPEDSKKTRCGSQNSGLGPGKRIGRLKKNQEVEET